MTTTYLVDKAAHSLANRRRSSRSDSRRSGWALAALTVAGVLTGRRLLERNAR